MAISTTIDPMAYITSHVPATEAMKSVSSWFKTERMELDFGDYVGRPDANITAHRELLQPLLAEGWYVTQVSGGGSNGVWQNVQTSSRQVSETSDSREDSVSDANTNQHGESSSSAQSTSSGMSSSDSSSSTNSSSEADSRTQTAVGDDTSLSVGRSSQSGSSSGVTSSNGTTNNNGTENAVGTTDNSGDEHSEASAQAHDEAQSTETTTVSSEDPYWSAWQRIRLERRRMQADAVLQSMVDSFVDNYNNGRRINLERYDELVALYALMVNQTQLDAQEIDPANIDFDSLFDRVRSAVEDKLSQYQRVADQIPYDWLESRKADINLKFDNLVGEARAKMVSDGTYNGTVWPSVEAGIEHQRSHALDALKDESVTLKLSAYGDIAKTTAGIHQQIVDAQVRIFEALQNKKITPINLRNSVLKWMYEFMERRNDPFPNIEDLPTVAERLGYSGGIAAPLSQVS